MTAAQQYQLTQDLKMYIKPVLTKLQNNLCALCDEFDDYYEIDHKRYGDDLTIYDLQLVCYNCHRQRTSIGNDLMLSRTQHCRSCTCWG